LADRFDHAGEFDAQDGILWLIPPKGDPRTKPEEEGHIEFVRGHLAEGAGGQ